MEKILLSLALAYVTLGSLPSEAAVFPVKLPTQAENCLPPGSVCWGYLGPHCCDGMGCYWSGFTGTCAK